MQINELNQYTGNPGTNDYLAIDNGSETTKIPATGLVPYPAYYGTCDTAASTTTKIVTCPEFVLRTGSIIAVKFANESTVTGTTNLNVNSTGAKRIRRSNGSTQAVNNIWDAGDITMFVYDGSSWILTGTETDIDSSVLTLYASLGWAQD